MLAAVAWVALAHPAAAQSIGDSGQSGQGQNGPGQGGLGQDGTGGHRGGGRRQRDEAPAPAPAALPPLKLRAEPRQRLEAGALLCPSEADLQQHQAAVVAASEGHEAAEPTGCRFIRSMTSVSVVERHGQARTEVRLPGPPEETGWTDAILPDAQLHER